MWTTVYDNTADWKTLHDRAVSEGYRFYFWASDDCYGFKGMYNGGTFVFYTDIEAIDDPWVKKDALAYGKEL